MVIGRSRCEGPMSEHDLGRPWTGAAGADRPRVVRDDLDVSYGLRAGTEPGWQQALQAPEPALRYLMCFLTAQDWVHRRVDTLAFSGVAHVDQHTSLDLTVPLTPPSYRLRNGLGVIVLPVAQVSKEPLINFDITDGNGHHLPLLTRQQSDTIAVLGMLQLASIALVRNGWPGRRPLVHDFSRHGYGVNADRSTYLDLPEWPQLAGGPVGAYTQAQEAIVRLVVGPVEEGERWVRCFETADRSSPLGVLWEQLTFRTFLRRLAGNTFIAATLPEGSNERQVINYSLERRRTASALEPVTLSSREIRELSGAEFWRDAAGLTRGLARNGLERLGLLPLSVLTDVSAAQDCASYHLEVETPKGLKITDLDWFIGPPTGDDPDGAAAEERIVRDLGPAPIGVIPDLRGGHEHDRVHTQISQVPLGSNLTCRLRMAPAASGWLLLAGPATLMAAALQVVFMLPGSAASLRSLPWLGPWLADWAHRGGLDGGVTNDELGAAVLQNRMTLALGVVALVGTVLLSWGENPLPKRLLLFPRLATVTVLVTLLVSSLYLIGDRRSLDAADVPLTGPPAAMLLLAALSALSVVCAELVAFGLVRKSRRSLARLVGRPDTRYWKVWTT
jgi:hypothetical protein